MTDFHQGASFAVAVEQKRFQVPTHVYQITKHAPFFICSSRAGCDKSSVCSCVSLLVYYSEYEPACFKIRHSQYRRAVFSFPLHAAQRDVSLVMVT